jgi:hypothetical protein
MVTSCGREYPHLSDERFDWEYRPVEVDVEMQIVKGEIETVGDSLTLPKVRVCGNVSDHGKLVLLCPSCLKMSGRKW